MCIIKDDNIVDNDGCKMFSISDLLRTSADINSSIDHRKHLSGENTANMMQHAIIML
jgi:hypothetical protein